MAVEGDRPKTRFTTIEAARGIAAILVVFHHAGNMVAQPRFVGVDPFGGHLKNFNVGVDFFFVLSGFIITWVHWNDLGHKERVGGYARKRFLRVFPPYWGVLFPLIVLYLAVPTAGVPSKHDPVNIALSIVLLPSTMEPVLGVGWTLVCEIIFYALFALLIAGGRKLLPLLALWAVIIVVANLLTSLPFPLNYLVSPFDLEFIAGVGVAVLLRRGSVPAPRMLLGAGLLIFLLPMLFALDVQNVALRARLVFGTGAALFVLGAVELERRRSFKLPRVLVFFGASSYVIYLIHPVVLSFGIQVIWHVGGRILPIDVLAVVLAILGVAAGVVYHLTAEPVFTALAARIIDWKRDHPTNASPR